MLVYVVIGGYDYEGCSGPLAAFSTHGAAEKFAAKLRKSKSHGRNVYDDVYVFKMNVNHPEKDSDEAL